MISGYNLKYDDIAIFYAFGAKKLVFYNSYRRLAVFLTNLSVYSLNISRVKMVYKNYIRFI